MSEGQRSISHEGSGFAATAGATRRSVPGLAFPRLLSRADLRPSEAVRWVHRDLVLHGASGRVLRDVEVPQDWSAEASLAFLVHYAGVDREEWPEGVDEPLSVRQSLDALLHEVRQCAIHQQYFSREQDADIFVDELAVLLLAQAAAFAGAPDSGGAWHWDGERTSPSRTQEEDAGEGGRPSPVLLAMEQPEVASLLERWARADVQFGTAAANAIVLLPDAPMLAAEHTGDGRAMPEPLMLLARAVARGDGPAVSFARNVERWNPTPETSTTATLCEASPCAATLNLQCFVDAGGELDVTALRHAAAVMTTALEMEVDRRSYRSEAVVWAMHRNRPLALGFCNLGVLLMGAGMAYDSPGARRLATGVASLIAGEAAMQSARIAETCASLRGRETEPGPWRSGELVMAGACDAFVTEAQHFLATVRRQRAETYRIVRGGESPTSGAAEGGVIPIRTEHSSTEPALLRQLPEIVNAARATWDAALTHGERFGYRNAQWTALPEAEAAGAMLEVETDGISPVATLLLPERRQGSGAAGEQRVRQAVAAGLFRLGYTAVESEAVLQHLEHGGALPEAPFLRSEDRSVFLPGGGAAELQMLSAVQPFLSAANPQRVRWTETIKPEVVATMLLEGWRTGVKALRIVTSGSDAAQTVEEEAMEQKPVVAAAAEGALADEPARRTEQGETAVVPQQTAPEGRSETARLLEVAPTLADAEKALLAREQAALMEVQLQRIADLELQVQDLQRAARASADAPDAQEPPRAVRHRLPAERASVTHKFSVAGHEGYVTVGLYPNGSPGEIFLRMSRESSSLAGLVDSFAITVSLGLQHGVPLRTLAEHLSDLRFEPSGETGNPQIPHARSIMQYLFDWMESRFLSGNQLDLFRGLRAVDASVPVTGDVRGASGRVTPRVGGFARPEGS